MNQINNGFARVNTLASQPRTSSNTNFSERFRAGVGAATDLTSNALAHIAPSIPGGPTLTASLSDAARVLSQPSGISGAPSSVANNAVNGDMNSLQEEMIRSNQEMLAQQARVSQTTTEFTTKSNILKAYTDTKKNIGGNIRS